MFKPLNVLGKPLESCSTQPMTGFFRDGLCNSGINNPARHVVCILATEAFLEHSKKLGNDLSTPLPQYGFDGVKAGDSWCLATGNFLRALEAGVAPKVFLNATHEVILEELELEVLMKYSVDCIEE